MRGKTAASSLTRMSWRSLVALKVCAQLANSLHLSLQTAWRLCAQCEEKEQLEVETPLHKLYLVLMSSFFFLTTFKRSNSRVTTNLGLTKRS